MDRTEWDRGAHQYHVLCIVVSIGKMAIPLYFKMLDNKSGNSNCDDRINVLRQIIEQLGKERIEMLTMDREFIGHRWLKWLKEQGICFCVRVPKSHYINELNGDRIKAQEILDDLVIGQHHYIYDTIVDGVVVEVSISRGKDGELLYLIGTLPAPKLCKTYRRRWPIEVFFQATKGRGFNMEQTGMRDSAKLRKLFALVSLSYAICWAIEIEQSKSAPVKTKKHGYPQYSVFRRGLNRLRSALKNGKDFIFDIIYHLILQRQKRLIGKTVG